MKNIIHLTSVHKALDSRIYYKELSSLKTHYNCTLVCNDKLIENSENIRIIALDYKGNKIERMFFSPFQMLKKALEIDADVYHLHDPELLISGLILKIFNKRVIYDVHENIKGMIQSRKWIRGRITKFLVSQIVWFLDRFSIMFFDGIVVARPDLFRFYKKSNTLLFRNFPDIMRFKNHLLERESSTNGKIRIIYSGGLTEIRGILNIIDAMDYLDNNYELILMGPWQEDHLKEKCEKRNGYKKTKYIGVFPYGEHFSQINISDIGIIPFLPSANHLTTLPNKPFEYMMCNIPMLMSNFNYWKKLFKDTAFYCNSMDPKNIANEIRNIATHPDITHATVKRAYITLINEYNLDKEKVKLLDFYSKLLSH